MVFHVGGNRVCDLSRIAYDGPENPAAYSRCPGPRSVGHWPGFAASSATDVCKSESREVFDGSCARGAGSRKFSYRPTAAGPTSTGRCEDGVPVGPGCYWISSCDSSRSRTPPGGGPRGQGRGRNPPPPPCRSLRVGHRGGGQGPAVVRSEGRRPSCGPGDQVEARVSRGPLLISPRGFPGQERLGSLTRLVRQGDGQTAPCRILPDSPA